MQKNIHIDCDISQLSLKCIINIRQQTDGDYHQLATKGFEIFQVTNFTI